MQKSLCPPIRRALISVSDKTNLVEFAKTLAALDIEILSTGGTARLLTENQIPVIEVANYTGFPEIMDGRVKTLHPKIHGGLLGRRGLDDELMAEQQIPPIDLLVVNLYPFQQVISNPDCDFANAIENIDIGGPTLLRAAAKNHAAVTVIVDSDDYNTVLNEIKTNEQIVSEATRFHLAKKAFAHTAQYDGAIANYLGTLNENFQPIDFPDTYSCQFIKKQDLRYGENPHQAAAFYTNHRADPASIAAATQLQGKALSYNNIADTDAALECVKEFTDQACAIVKHANPCGVALANTQLAAYLRAFATDPTSSFGGIIAFNHPLEAETADAIIKKQFVEVIIAPGISEAAEQILTNKPNVRILSCESWDKNNKPRFDYKRVNGGLLIQEYDSISLIPEKLQTVTKRQPNEQELVDLFFAWNVAKHVKSNAIVYAAQQATVGIGAGQMSRVYSARIASIKAQDENLEVSGSVMASDAFFPFRDGIDAAAKAGITAVIQPGGSIRDEEVIQAANEANIAMVFTGIRHFRH